MFSLGERHEIYMIGSSIAARYLRYAHTPCALARMLFVFCLLLTVAFLCLVPLLQSDNGCMRDPVAFRCNLSSHWRTGTKYKVRGASSSGCCTLHSFIVILTV